VRLIGGLLIVLGPALYLVPLFTLLMLLCGVLDVSRQRRIRSDLIEKYFMGKDIPT
jgi:uncharacterized membrane protein